MMIGRELFGEGLSAWDREHSDRSISQPRRTIGVPANSGMFIEAAHRRHARLAKRPTRCPPKKNTRIWRGQFGAKSFETIREAIFSRASRANGLLGTRV